MTTLRLENETDVIHLDEVERQGYGYQALSGAIGFGLPPVSVQWLEGAGDGAVYRRRRVLSRDIDLQLDILGRNRQDLKSRLSRLSLMLSGPCTLRFVEPGGTSWTTRVVRTGGGDYTYGVDTTGERDVQMVVTFRSSDPYWESSVVESQTIGGYGAVLPFVSNFGSLPVAPSQAIGSIEMRNSGDVEAFPVWQIYGPGDTFRAVSEARQELVWEGALDVGESLTIDTRRGTVVDGDGVNRYAELAPAPRFWPVPPGTNTAEASLLNTNEDSRIVCTWRARKWVVI